MDRLERASFDVPPPRYADSVISAAITMTRSDEIRLKRAYDRPADDDGRRILVDRIWPRGVARADAKITTWLKALAPSTALRQWFGHDPARFDVFAAAYRNELATGETAAALAELIGYHQAGRITLVYGARDRDHNNAVVLQGVLAERARADRDS